MRDDFSQRTKDLLANRVGWKCSNPNCRKATRGAGIGKEKLHLILQQLLRADQGMMRT